MDPQTMVIGAGIFVVSAIMIYLISVCSMQEKTFEEVLEEQRRLQAEELKKQRIEKKDKVRKRYPGRGKGKKGDKADEKSASVGILESESENDRVAEVEVSEPVLAPVQQQQTKSERKNKKDKKKLKEEVAVPHEDDLYEPLVKDQVEEVMVAQKVETVEAPAHGHRKGKRGGGVAQAPAQQAEQALEEEIIVEEQIQVQAAAPLNYLKEEAPLQQSAPDNIKKSKKKSAELGAGGDDAHPGTGSDLVQMVKQAVLSQTELTLLVEILQTKQGTPAQWTKKSKQADAISLLKKQLEDKEKSFQDEQQLAQNAAQKLRDLRADLARERQRYEVLQKQAAERMKGQEEEKEALQARMQQTHEQHTAEVMAMRRQVDTSKMAQVQTGLVQRLSDENQKLKEAANQAQAAAHQATNDKVTLKMLQEELSKNVMKLNMSTSTNKSLEVKFNRAKEQLKSMENTQHETVSRQISDITEQLRRSENHNTALSKDLDTARSSAGHLEQELANVHSRVKDFQAQEGHAHALEQQLQESMHTKNSLESRLSEMERINKKTDSQLKQLCEENNLLAAQLKESKERTAGEGQEAPSAEQNGEMVAPAKPDPQVIQLLGEKEAEVSKLQAELQAKLQETTELSMDLEAQKAKNNALREKNWKAMDALSKAETMAEGAASLKDNLSSKNIELERLKKELQMAEKHNHELVSKQEAVVVELTQQSTNKDAQLIVLKRMEGELKAQTEDFTKKEQDFSNQQKMAESYKVQKDEMVKEVTALKEQLEAQAKELNAVTKLKAEVATMEEELSKLVESQQVKMEELRGQLGKDVKSKETEVEQLTEQFNVLKQQNQELVKSTESSSSQLSTQVAQLTQELTTKAADVSSLQQKVKNMEGSMEKLAKDADNSADAARLSTELATKNQQLQDVIKELADIRAENQALEVEKQQQLMQQESAVLNSTSPVSPTTTLQDVTILTRVQEKSSFDVSQILMDLETRDVELSIMQNVLSQKEAENRKFKEQLAETNSLRRELNDRALEVVSLSQQLNLQKQKTHEVQDQLSRGQPAAPALPPDVAFLKDELEVKATEITNLRDIVKSYWTENNALKEKVDALEDAAEEKQSTPPSVEQNNAAHLEEVSQVRTELDKRKAMCSHLQESVSQLHNEAQELQDKIKEVTEELQTTKQQANSSSVLQDELQNTKEVLHRIFPNITVADTKYSEWISTLEKQAPQYIISDTQNGTDKELEESLAAQTRLQAQVHQYKDVLADTEGILNKLQNSVEEEESKWRLRVAAAEERSNQLELEVKNLQGNLSTIEDDRLSLQSKISESTQSLNSLKTELMDLNCDSTSKEEGQANGSSRPQEMEQLKTSLVQTQKQLEREVQLNRQLTQRLAAGAESSGDGTSA